MLTYNEEEVANHNTPEDAWVILDCNVYNITPFLSLHPGGTDVLIDFLGKDVSHAMRDEMTHSHTDNAFSFIDSYKIGTLVPSETMDQPCDYSQSNDAPSPRKGWGKVDMEKPLVSQVGLLGPDYAEWVEHDPLPMTEPRILFSNSLLERLSRTEWYVVPLIWIPVSIVTLYLSHLNDMPLWALPFGWAAGVVVWMLLEWNLHRFLFHSWRLAKYGSYYTNILHFLLHGFHHKIPMDRCRLVLPPALLTILSIPWVWLDLALLPSSIAWALISGAYSGCVYYDMMHFWLHHGTSLDAKLPSGLKKWWRSMRSHHMTHHFSPWDSDINYGISNQVLDVLFGTHKQ